MAELLYQTNSYFQEFEATVLEVKGAQVALNCTAFYPRGGGQPCDTGVFLVGSRSLPVLRVRQQRGVVLHQVDGNPPLAPACNLCTHSRDLGVGLTGRWRDARGKHL